MREVALRVLFEADVGRQPLAGALAGVRAAVPEREWPFVRAICEGTWNARKQIDARLAQVSRGWSVERMANTDRSVLRMAAYELLHMETPARVVINEAVELAKKYGTEDSGRFVNGVLGGLHRALIDKARVADA